jgi:GNAT superfamily N-acetyltransferase
MSRDAARLAVLERTDCERLRRFFHRLSPEARYHRFLAPVVSPDQLQSRRLFELDHRDREAVTALVGDEIIGVARYARVHGQSAEIAVVVEDAWQRRGIGSSIVRRLEEHACASGMSWFTGLMHADNRPAILFLRSLFPSARFHLDAGLLAVDIALTDPGRAAGN